MVKVEEDEENEDEESEEDQKDCDVEALIIVRGKCNQNL